MKKYAFGVDAGGTTCKHTESALATLGNDAGMYGGVQVLLGDEDESDKVKRL